MHRMPRNIHENGFFHIMVQGINKCYIFDKNIDKEYYLSLLFKYKEKFKIMLLAYCIMDNHAHLLIFTNDINELSEYMRIINSKFAINYNAANNRVGYVFRDRFKSQYIKKNDYLLKCLNYIHMNPVKAGMVKNPEEYKYSSYNNYIQKEGNVNDSILKKIFKNPNNYLNEFTSISNEEIEVMDVDRDEKNFEIVVKKYLRLKNITIDELKKNKLKLYDFCNYMIIEKKYKQNKIAKLINMDRSKIYRTMKKQK